MQWVNLFPEIKDHLVTIFERYRHVLDAELQQRACEYYTIAVMEDDNALLETVCEEMPPFPERESALLNRLHSKGDTGHEKRTWVIGGKGDNKGRETARFKSFKDGSAAAEPAVPVTQRVHQETQNSQPADAGEYDLMGADPSMAANDDVMNSLAGLDLGGGNVTAEAPLIPSAAPLPGNGYPATAIPPAEEASHVSTSVALAQMALTRGANVDKVRLDSAQTET